MQNYSQDVKQNINAQSQQVVYDKALARDERFFLQDKARKILTKTVQRGKKWAYVHRVNYCLHTQIDKNKGVGLTYNSELGSANFTNLQRCSSVWTCPVCSAQISEARRIELKNGLRKWRNKKGGGYVYLVTFTNRHHCGDDLDDLVKGQKKAFDKFWSKTKVVKTLKDMGLAYRITATEVTYNDDNGWHPHYHMLFLCNKRLSMTRLQKFLALEWRIACKKAGLKLPDLRYGVDVRNGSYADKYVSKWGLDYEMTKGHTKRGKEGGLTPFDLLRKSDKSNDKYAKLFSEFSDVFKGRRQLVWSDGCKSALDIEQKTDEQIINDTDNNTNIEFVRELSSTIWLLVKMYNARSQVLYCLESDYKDNGGRLDFLIDDLCNRFVSDFSSG